MRDGPQVGSLLDVKEKPSQRMHDHWSGRETNGVRSTLKTSEIFGRERGSLSQHFPIISHKSRVKFGCVGRSGRLPFNMANAARMSSSPGNGIASVNICIDTKRQ